MLRTRVRAGPVAGAVLSLAVALLLTVLQPLDRLVDRWAPRWGEPAPVTLRVEGGPTITRDADGAHLRHEHTRRLVPRGTVLDPKNEDHRRAFLADRSERPPSWARLAGTFAIHFALLFGLTSYLRRFGQNRLRLLRVQVGILVAMALMVAFAKTALLVTALPAFWLPIGAVPLWVAIVYDRRTAFAVSVTLALLIAGLLQFDLLIVAVLFLCTVTAVLLHVRRKSSTEMVLAGAGAGAVAVGVHIALLAAFEGGVSIGADLANLERSELLATLGGGLLSGIVGLLLRPAAEGLLGNVARERLLALQDLEQPLLQKLASEAPGTHEHSRAVANLAEAAASAIGVDALLTRVGAYYHDIGKTVQSKYFVENLGVDERSPHDELDPETSADAIMAHVVVGTRLAREGRLPEPVVEFCYTHHGTQLVEYFWNKCREQGNPNGLTEAHFRYPGMRPQTKETAIVMLVDSIEAASRTVNPPVRAELENMVHLVVFTKLRSGQLDDSGLDMADLRIIVSRVVEALVNMNHHRIKYPWQAKRAEEFGVPSRALRPDSNAAPLALASVSSVPQPSSAPAVSAASKPATVIDLSTTSPSPVVELRPSVPLTPEDESAAPPATRSSSSLAEPDPPEVR